MAIQNRRGAYNDFTPSKMVPGEFAVVQSGDPNGSSGKAVYIAFTAGDVKRLATYEDIASDIEEATSEIAESLVAQIEADVADDLEAAQQAASDASDYKDAASDSASAASTSATNAANAVKNSVAPAFSTSTAYAIGDYVVYENQLYRFTSAHSAGAWNSSHVTATTVSEDLEDFNDELSSTKADLDNIFDGVYYNNPMSMTSKTAERGIANDGGVIYDADKTLMKYQVTAGDLLYLKLAANTGASTAIYVFKEGSAMTSNNVGSVCLSAIDGRVRVPTGATYLMVSQPTTSTTFIVAEVTPIEYQDKINNILDGAYEGVKGGFQIGSILNGVNSTTTTRIRHVSPVSYDRDITLFVKSGYQFYVVFYADAAGTQFLRTREFATNDLPVTIASGMYFRLVICKTTEVTVTDISEYVKAILITTRLFNNPFIYKNALIRQVAHQGYAGDPTQSTGRCLASSYRYAALVGFTHGECDIKFTSDGVPVCCHDATFTDKTTGNTITIASKTYSELVTYNYYDGTIASFDDVVKACKISGLGIYIDHLDGSWSNVQWKALFDILQKYNMSANAYWLIPSISSLLNGVISEWDKNANYCLVMTSAPENYDSLMTSLKALKTDSNIVSIDLPSSAITPSDIAQYALITPPEIEIEIWTVDTVTNWNAYLPYVSGITSNKICANIARLLT